MAYHASVVFIRLYLSIFLYVRKACCSEGTKKGSLAGASFNQSFLSELGNVGVGVQKDEGNNEGVNGQRFDEGVSQNHGTGNLAAHFRIAGNAFHGALKAETHTNAATAGAEADAESSAEAGGAEGGGVKGGAGSKGHGGNAEQGNHVKSDEKIFTHWNTP